MTKTEHVWFHQTCLVASLSLKGFPRRASGKLSENHLVVDANEPLWTPFPVCRCLWLSITFKMLNVEQMYCTSSHFLPRFSFFLSLFSKSFQGNIIMTQLMTLWYCHYEILLQIRTNNKISWSFRISSSATVFPPHLLLNAGFLIIHLRNFQTGGLLMHLLHVLYQSARFFLLWSMEPFMYAIKEPSLSSDCSWMALDPIEAQGCIQICQTISEGWSDSLRTDFCPLYFLCLLSPPRKPYITRTVLSPCPTLTKQSQFPLKSYYKICLLLFAANILIRVIIAFQSIRVHIVLFKLFSQKMTELFF